MAHTDRTPAHGQHATLGALSVRPYGTAAVLIDVAGPVEVQRLRRAIEVSEPSLRPRPGWSSVLVDTERAPIQVLNQLLAMNDAAVFDAVAGDLHVIDVVYDGSDLEAVARITNLSVADVITAHSAPEYSVVFLGFARAFPYLAGLDERLSAVPRLDTPRVRVPAGSVGIAAGQTGIYPMDSPGGWHLLGRTDAVMFDPDREPPSRLAPGDRVRFRAVSAT